MTILHKIKDQLVLAFLYFFTACLVVLLGFQVFMLTASTETTRRISNELTWKFDGRFKNSPGSIWYQEPKAMAIGVIANKVKIGALAGNRNLEFGIKSTLEEALQDKGYDLDKSSENRIEIDIVYLDVLKTQSSLSVFHKDKESVVIRLFARVYKGDKLVKKFLVEESADEISMSTLAIDMGGKFNQQNLSSALKKTVVAVVNKL